MTTLFTRKNMYSLVSFTVILSLMLALVGSLGIGEALAQEINPKIGVIYNTDAVAIWDWSDGYQLTLTIDDPDNGVGVDYTDTQSSAEGVFYTNGAFDIQPGQLVTVTDGAITRQTTVTDVEISSVDPMTNIVIGTADPLDSITVATWWNCGYQTLAVTADINGDWMVDFSGTCDIIPGTTVGAYEYDNDGDSTRFDWRVPNPSLSVRILDNEIHGYEWSEGAEVTLTIDGIYSDTQTVMPADWDPNQTFVRFSFGENWTLASGQSIVLTDGSITKTHTVTELIVTGTDPEADTVSGTAAPGSQVDIGHLSCDEFGCYGYRRETADVNGDWLADFSVVGEDDDEQDIIDLYPGMRNEARQCDEDGDCTQYDWYILRPDITAAPSNDWVSGEEWPIDALITIEIDDPDTIEAPDFTTTEIATTDGWRDNQRGGNFQYWSEYDFSPGDTVTLSDGITTKSLIVSDNQFDADIDNDILFGVTDPEREIWVFVSNENIDGKQTQSDANGNWSVSFAGEYDIDVGSSFGIKVFDDDGDMTHLDWQVVRPEVWAHPNDSSEDWIDVRDWTFGETVYLTIDNDTDPLNGVLYSDSGEVGPAGWNPSVGVKEFHLGSFDLQPGHFVTVNGPTTTKELVITNIDLTEINTELGTISGTADPYSAVQAWQHEEPHCNDEVFADQYGNWTVDFSECNFGPGVGGGVGQADADGDSTVYFWWAPEDPQVQIVINHQEIHCSYWPFGAELSLTIDDPDNGTGVDYSATAWVDEVLNGDETFAMFAPGEQYEIQPGDIVTVTDGNTIKQHTVFHLDVTSIDVDTDTFIGTATPGETVEAYTWTGQGERCSTIVSGTGDWTINVSDPLCEQPFDIQLGSEGALIIHGQDNTDTQYFWKIANPQLGIRPSEDRIEGWEWELGAMVDIAIDDPGTPESPDYSDTAEVVEADWDPNQTRLDLWVDYDIKPGDIVTATDGSVTKVHTVTALTMDNADVDTDIVTGSADPDSRVDVWICDNQGCANRHVYADGGGQWSADFANPGDEDDEQDTRDITLGTWIDSSQNDEDGDGTYAGIYLNNPTFRINPNLWEVEVWEWPLGVPVTLNIDDPSNGPGVDYTDTQFAFVADWDPNSTYIQFNFRDLFDVLPGFIVTLSDGSITKEHVVSNQVVTSIDPLTDQVSGTADPGTELLAHICNEYGCTEVYVTADEYGNWIADYSGLYDLVPGTNGTVIYYDEDGDAAGIYWEIPNPTFGVRANHDNIEGWQWDEGATVTITIDDPSTPENPDYDDTTTVGIADWDPNQTWFTLELGGVYDIKVGDFVTVSDGAITKEHTVLNLTFTEFDTDADVVHGIGVPDSQINVWTCDDYGCINREEFTDGAGNWSVDFSIPGDLDWEQETADLVPGSWVDSSQSDEDGDQTMYGTNILSFTLHAVPSHPEVHGHDWEPGSDVTLIIDNDNDPDNGILYEDTRNVDDDPWCGNPCFDLSGIFDLQVGHYVTMTAGAMSKTVLVSQLTVTEVNYENDTVSGIADPGSRVAVNIWSQDGNARYVTADTAGLWVANFSQVGDEDFEQELADIQEWDWGRAIQLNPDDSDDGTLEYWGEGPSIWEAPDDVPLVAALSYSPDLNRLGFDYEAWSVANLLWEPLFRTTDQGDLMPAAASDYTVSPDGLVYTITLRDDALWSDGTPLEAQHFVDGFLRLISPDTATDYGHLLYEIDGAEAYALGETTDPNTVGLLALNNQTLQITLHRPAAYFIKVLANPGMVPARADLLDLYEDSWIAPENFVGNGPYTLLEYDDRHLLVEKNQNFHDADQLAFHQIGFAVISDENQRLDAYREGLVDVMISASTDIAKEPELASDRYPRALGIYFVGLNTEKPPLDNSLVRKALASAIDRDYMMGDIFETPWMQSATGVIPPDVPGHQGDTVGYLFDEAQAQTYLSDAGYPGGAGFPEIVLYVNDGSSDSMEYVAEQWRTVLGIPVRIQYTDWGTYSAYLRSCHQDPASCNYHAYRLGWLVDYHDAYSILGDVFHPDANFSLWDSTLYRDLIDLSLGELDPAQRLTYLEQAEQVLVEDEAAAIPLAFAYQTSLAKQTFEPAFGLVPYLDLWSYAPPTMGVYAADESMPSSEVVEIYNWAGEEVSIIIDDPATPEVGDYFETRTSVPLPEFFSGMYPGVEKIARFELAGRVDIEPGFTISVEGSPEAAYTVSDLSITNVDLGLDTVSGTSAPNEQVDLNACNNYDPSECVSFSVVADGGYWLADFGAWGFDLQVGSEGSARLYDEDGNRTMVDFSVLTSAGTGFTPTSEVVIQPGETINLAAAVNLTGPATYIGEDAIHALQMAIDDHGPIAGFDIQFAEFDSACDFASGEQAALQVVADPSIVGVIGHVCSSSVKGGAPIYEEAGLVTLSGSATMHTVPAYGPTVFSRTIFSDFDHDSAYWLDELGGYQSVQAWNYDFEARFGTAPSNFAVLYYDAARLLLERIEETALLQGGGELVINRAALAAAVRDTAVREADSGCWSLGYNGSRQECGGGLVNISYNEKLIWAPFWGIGDELTLHIYDQDDNLIYNPEPQVVAQAWFASEGVDFPHAIFYYGDEFEMQPGYRVVVSNGEITKETVATELTLGTLDAISDQISGTASPGSHIFVEAWQFGVRRHALADSAGNWYVDFGVPGDEAFEGDVLDIEAITALDIAQFTGENKTYLASPIGEIRGTVLLDGQPLSDVEVWVNGPIFNGERYSWFTCTDANGQFVVEKTPPGPIDGFVSATGPSVAIACANAEFLDENGIPLLVQFWDHADGFFDATFFDFDPLAQPHGNPYIELQYDVMRAAAIQDVHTYVHIVDQAGSGACPLGETECDLPLNDIAVNAYAASELVTGWTSGIPPFGDGNSQLRYRTVSDLTIEASYLDAESGAELIVTLPVSAADFADRGDGVLAAPTLTFNFIKVIAPDGSVSLYFDTDGDHVADGDDNAPEDYNPDQRDVDGDGVADVLDPCPDDNTDACDAGASGSDVVGSDGGAVETLDGGVSLSIPAGALSEEISFSITESGAGYELTSDDGVLFVLQSYSIQPGGTIFDPPALLTMHWDDADNDGIIDGTSYEEANIALFKDGVLQTNASLDLDANLLTVEIGSLSFFELAVFTNSPPVADAGPDQTVYEGDSVTLSGAGSTDPDNDELAYAWDLDNDGAYDDANGVTVNWAFADDGIYTVGLQVTDPGGLTDTDTTEITVLNVAPQITAITAPIEPVQVGQLVETSAFFTDPGTNDTHTASWDWGDGASSNGVVSGYYITGTHQYTIPGVYTLTLTLADDDGGVATELYQYIVVFDPDGGFVTGGGWFTDPVTADKASFGFNAKYQMDAKIPFGNAHFKVGDLRFESTAYDWLVVSGERAQFQGTGTVNDVAGYSFFVTVVDGKILGDGDDYFRIKIWDPATGVVVYDNHPTLPDNADPVVVIKGGSIVIHK